MQHSAVTGSTPLYASVRPGQDTRTASARLGRARDAVLSGSADDGGAADPRPVIRASWRRVRRTGLDPAGPAEGALLGLGELQRRREASGLGQLLPLLRARLLPAAEAAGQLMVVADPTGRVLWREGGPDVRRRADALGFVEGSAWDEAHVGTNAIGTSLVVGEPLQVHAAEHWSDSHQPWTCAAAPLHDPVSGRLLGAVDLSGPAPTVHASTVALVDAVARLAELEVRAAHEHRLRRLRGVAAPLLARLSGPALVVALDGTTAASTGLTAPDRVPLPDVLHQGLLDDGVLWLPALGRCSAEPLPGGWLLRQLPDDDAGTPAGTRLVLDLSGEAPRLTVTGPSGAWTHTPTPRHAELLLTLARHPAGLTAGQLAADLFGDPGRTVTVRAEVSRLRRALGPLLCSQPYRFAGDVRVELVPPAP